jgi:hypothetical protein
MKIIIFDPFLSQSLTIAAMLKENCKDIKIYGVTDKNISAKNKYYDGFLTENNIIENDKDCILIPTGAIITKKYLQRGNINIGEACLSQNNLIVYDKIAFYDLMSKTDIPVPITWKNITDIPEDAYPIFYKQKEEIGGGIRGIAKKKKNIPLQYTHDLIYQEYINNSKGTYGVSFIAHDGNILCSHIHFERESIPESGGSAVFIENFHDERLVNYTKSILQCINYSGWGLAEYKYCKKRNDYVLMEINSKFWASCEFTFRNNPTFFKILFNLNIKNENIGKMTFIDRVFERGFLFFIINIGYILTSKIICQILSFKHFFSLIIPTFIKRILKKMLNLY